MSGTCISLLRESSEKRHGRIKNRVKSVIGRLKVNCEHQTGTMPSNCLVRRNCFEYHRIDSSSARLSGHDCSFQSDLDCNKENISTFRYKALPPIGGTVLREKDPNKWYTDMLDYLVNVGNDPNKLNQYGEAPLCVASFKSQGLVVSELLTRDNVDVNIRGRHGRTPLYLAAEEGHVYIVKCLLAHPDIDVNCRNSPSNATPLIIASRRGHTRVVQLLLQHPGIKLDLLDKDGESAISYVRSNNIKQLLQQAITTFSSDIRL